MKPHPRIRKAVKWGGAVVSVLLVVAWVGSGWWKVSWGNALWERARLHAGCITVRNSTSMEEFCEYRHEDARCCLEAITDWDTPWPPIGGIPSSANEARAECYAIFEEMRFQCRLIRESRSMSLAFEWFGQPGETTVSIPLWACLVPLATVVCSAWRFDARAHRHARVGFCFKCNYDRAGIAAGAVCPECGAGAVGSDSSLRRESV